MTKRWVGVVVAVVVSATILLGFRHWMREAREPTSIDPITAYYWADRAPWDQQWQIRKDVTHLLPQERVDREQLLEAYNFHRDQRQFVDTPQTSGARTRDGASQTAMQEAETAQPETRFADMQPLSLKFPLAEGANRREYLSRDLGDLLDTGCLLSTTVALDVGSQGQLIAATAYFSQPSVLCF